MLYVTSIRYADIKNATIVTAKIRKGFEVSIYLYEKISHINLNTIIPNTQIRIFPRLLFCPTDDTTKSVLLSMLLIPVIMSASPNVPILEILLPVASPPEGTLTLTIALVNTGGFFIPLKIVSIYYISTFID